MPDFTFQINGLRLLLRPRRVQNSVRKVQDSAEIDRCGARATAAAPAARGQRRGARGGGGAHQIHFIL